MDKLLSSTNLRRQQHGVDTHICLGHSCSELLYLCSIKQVCIQLRRLSRLYNAISLIALALR